MSDDIYGGYFREYQRQWESDLPSGEELKDSIIDAEKIVGGQKAWLLWCEDHGFNADVDSQQSYDQLLEYVGDSEEASRGHHDDSRSDELRGT